MEQIFSLGFIENIDNINNDLYYECENKEDLLSNWSYLSYWALKKFKANLDEDNYKVDWNNASIQLTLPIELQDNLIAFKFNYSKKVSEYAEEKRLKYILPGTGQAISYLCIKEEAEKCLLDDNPTFEKYKLLASETDFGEESLKVVAEKTIEIYNNWVIIQSNINRERRIAQRDIENATENNAVVEIYNLFKQKLDLI